MAATGEPVTVVWLCAGGRSVRLGVVDGSTICDLALVDDLARLSLVVGRLGWSVRLVDARADLVELLTLAGLDDRLWGRTRDPD